MQLDVGVSPPAHIIKINYHLIPDCQNEPWKSQNQTPHGGDICSMQRDVESVHSGHYGRHMGIQSMLHVLL